MSKSNHPTLQFSPRGWWDVHDRQEPSCLDKEPLGPTTQANPSAAPPNIYGSRVFLINLQFGSNYLYIYDRKSQ